MGARKDWALRAADWDSSLIAYDEVVMKVEECQKEKKELKGVVLVQDEEQAVAVQNMVKEVEQRASCLSGARRRDTGVCRA